MEKQTAIYLTEKDRQRLERIKENQDTKKTNDVIKTLIKEEYDRIIKYTGL